MPSHVFRQARFLTSAAELSGLPAESLAEVAFAGRSNAGKSSALNTLADHRRLAFVSKTPGRTQLLNYFDLGGGRSLVDLPGFGYAKVPLAVRAPWGRLLGDYLLTRQSLRGLVLVMDSRHPMTDLDVRLIEWFLPTGKPVHVLLTKADKLSRGESTLTLREVRAQLQAIAPNHSVQLFSSLKKSGVEEVEAMLAAWLEMPSTERESAQVAGEGPPAAGEKAPRKKPAARRPSPKPRRRTYG